MKHFLPNFTNARFVFIFLSIIFFSLFVIFGIVSTKAFAASDESISAYPTHPSDSDPRTKSWFIYTLPGGEKRMDSVSVVNTGYTPVTLKVYSVDSTKASDGSFALAAGNAPKTDVGSWISLTTSEVILGPKQRQDIPFTITIPSNASVGDHSGGIIFEETTPKKLNSKGLNINVISRIGVRIYETVPGAEQLGMKIDDFHYSVVNNYLNFSLTAEDTGTVHISPTGMLEVKDMFGRTLNRTPLGSLFDTFVPGKPQTVTIATQSLAPVLGWSSATVALYYSPTKVAVSHLIIVGNPWALFGLLFVAILVIALIVFRKSLFSVKGKNRKVTPAPHIWIIVGGILLGTVAFSWGVSFLLTFFLAGK